MKLGHLISILSFGVISGGIVLMAMAGINSSHPFLSQNMLVTSDSIKSKETKNKILTVTDIGPTMYLVIKSDPSNIPLSAVVKDPNRSVVSSSTFSQDLVADFKPDKMGRYDLILINQGSTDVKFDAILGYIPLFGENGRPNYNALGSIFIGASLLVAGCFGFAAGLFISIKNQSPHGIAKSRYAFLDDIARRIIQYFNSGHWTLRGSPSTAKHHSLLAEKLGELEKEKHREKQINEFELSEKKEYLAGDESCFKP